MTTAPAEQRPAAEFSARELVARLKAWLSGRAAFASLFRTQAFRIVLLYVLLFAISATTLIAFTYWNTKRELDAQSDQVIEAEITGLSEQYQQLGLRGLAQVIISRSIHGGQGIYLLSDQDRRPIAGNLDAWPQVSVQGDDFVEFDYQRRINNQVEQRRARGKTFSLMGGFLLLVAQDVHDRYLMERLFSTTVPWTLFLMLVFGVVGGGLISRNMIARLDSINRTSKEIIAGDLSRRVPLTGAQDEFDTLAENLNRMLDRIERLMNGVREVTDSIAHDLRTPLNRLRNRLEAVAHHPDRAAGGEMESAVQETDQLIATFNALLLIAEADAGLAREAMAHVELDDVVAGVVELYGPLAEERGLDLQIKTTAGCAIDGNRSLVSQALANLVDNAIKYTPSGGRVVVATRQSNDFVALEVSDSGPGIPAGERTHVVERFVRLEASRHSPGTGLGLSLVAAVARLHDAQLVLDDNGPGLKASIQFRRPVPHSNQQTKIRART
jgi:signal transduction histidine kinase